MLHRPIEVTAESSRSQHRDNDKWDQPVVQTSYSEKGVTFSVPNGWEVVDDDFDEVIRAITLGCPNGGYYMIDVYNREQAPNINKYIDRQIAYFAKELPFGFKIVDGPTSTPEKSLHNGKEVAGVHVSFKVRTRLLQRIEYMNSFYRIETGARTSMISCQYLTEFHSESRAGFEELLEDYCAS